MNDFRSLDAFFVRQYVDEVDIATVNASLEAYRTFKNLGFVNRNEASLYITEKGRKFNDEIIWKDK